MESEDENSWIEVLDEELEDEFNKLELEDEFDTPVVIPGILACEVFSDLDAPRLDA